MFALFEEKKGEVGKQRKEDKVGLEKKSGVTAGGDGF